MGKTSTRIASILLSFVALSASLMAVSPAQAAQTSTSFSATAISPEILQGRAQDPAVLTGMKVLYVQTNAAVLKQSNLQTQCISTNMHMTWYGLTARQCKANDASGAQFTIFNSATGKAVSKVNLKSIKLPPIGKSISLGCIVSATGFALTLPGSPASTVGWILKGASVIVAAAGIATSCP